MEECLEKLFSCLPDREDEAKTHIHRIVSILHSELSVEERRIALYTLFQEEKGIQSFLSVCVRSNTKRIPSEILSIFLFLLETYPSSLENYIVTIKNECLAFIRRDGSSADEKVKSLEVLIAVVRHGLPSAIIDAPAILSQLSRMTSYKISKPTVLCKVYGLIGAMAEHMPEAVDPFSRKLLKSLMLDFDYQINLTAKVQHQIIEGCCEGLSGFLVSFTLHEKTDCDLCSKISNFIKRMLKGYQDKGIRTAARAALNLLARHGEQLQANLVSDYVDWHQVLQKWLHIGKEERAVTKQALLTFYSELSSFISRTKKMDMLTFFTDHFKQQFKTSEDLDIVVRGFGLFAKPIKMHIPDELPGIFNILSQRSQEECGKGNNHRIADYLDSLSVLSAESGIVHSLQLAILEKLSVELLSQFAQEEHPIWQTVMVDSVVCTLLRLSRCSGHALDMYLKTFVYQGIIRSVSHPLVEDAEILRETERKKITTYRNYLPFWQCVITLNKSSKGKSCIYADINEKRKLSRKILDRILESIVEIINRLDLSLNENVSSELIYHCDMKKCVGANNPLDFTVLVNLVNFTFDLLSNLPDQSYLEKWISPLIKLNIKLSTKHPLVSSFYKFLTCVILIAQKLDYFDDKTDNEMEDVEWRPTVNLLSGFLHDVITRQTQYRDELQVACLRLMLSTPSCIAKPLLRLSVTAFQTVFRIGCSMLSLAQEGLRTLARWNQDIPDEKMKILLKAVLPSFDILLQTRDNIAFEDDCDAEEEDSPRGMAMVKKVLMDRKKKKLWKQKVHTQSDTELVQLQKDVILFLCTLDSSSYLSLLDGSEDRVGVTAWQKEKLLMFPLPFPDLKVNISLDDILPRLAHLASNCSDRQTRSAACELLHAVIMFMLGKEKQLESTQQGHLTALWTHLFPTILTLACDMDSMVKQLFAPLGEEMAHWYSSKSQERSKQASAFLEALLEGITHQTDAALRDYSASCLHEYALWSRKQGHMIAKVEPILKFVSSLCHHPCPQKRMGAALAFNSLYSVLREDERIVDEFWVELLHSLVTSFSMCSMTGDDSNTEVQTDKSLQHILRVLIECSNKFNTDSKNRRIPKELGGGNLSAVVCWLLKYCTALNSSCRHSCMKLVDRLSGYITECRSTKDLILRLINANGENCLLEIAEGAKGLSTSLSKPVPWEQAIAWVYSLLASMESYIWLIETGISAGTLFTMTNSRLMQALMHFLESVVNSPVDHTSLWRPKEMENFNVAKCCTVVRMIEFLTLVLEKGQVSVLEPFWSSNFWQMLADCCVWPSHVGFDSTSKSVEENLPNIVEKFFKTMTIHASLSTLIDLKEHLEDSVSKMASDLLQRFPEAVRNDNVLLKDKDLVRGLRVLHSVFQEAQNWSGLVQESSLRVVFLSIVKPVPNSELCEPVTLSPLALDYTTSMLKLYFTTNSDVKPLLLLALNKSPLYRRSIEGDLTHGEHFVASFSDTLAQRLLRTPSTSIQILVELLSPEIHPQNLVVVQSVLKSNCRPKSATWNRMQEFIECLFSCWRKFGHWAQEDCNKEGWLISILVQIVQLDLSFHSIMNCDVICSWMMEVLTDPSKSLAQKTDLLHCLPIICSHSQEDDVKALLQSFKEHHFPLQSSEFKNGTEEHSNFKRAFEVLLKSLIVTGSCIILQMVVKMMASDEKHACRDLLPATLQNFMIRLVAKPDLQFESLKVVFAMFEEDMRTFDVRFYILQEFLLKLFMYSSLHSQKLFACFVIKKLLFFIKCRVKIENTARVRQILVSQIGSWSLLQQIYGIPERSLFETPGSELVLAAFHGSEDTKVTTGKELTAYLTRRALEAFQYPPNFERVPDDIKEMFRKYLCAVYNTFVTFICNLKTSPTDAKFYDKFLFDETSKKVWCQLIDERKRYLLPFCETEHLKNVEKVTSIRQKLTEDQAAGKGDALKALQIFESQSFAGSLESDITRFDFSHSRLLKAVGNQECNSEKTIIELEGDSLNNHECMATICGAIRHLVDDGITPVPPVADRSAPVLPGWMASLKNSLLDHACPHNSRIFILRVILNCEVYFAPYAVHWIHAILDCTVRTCLNVGDGISYLLGDIICLLAKWNADVPSVKINSGQVNTLFDYLVTESPSTVQSVFKYHLELIRSSLAVWKDFIKPPYAKLERILNFPEKKVGINLTAILLFYDLIPWTSESKNQFLVFLMNSLRDSRKTVFKASSELIGLCLKHMNEETDDQLLKQKLEAYLHDVHSKDRDCDRFLTVLYGVHGNFPQIADTFIPTIRFYLDQTSDDRKALCVCLLSKHLDYFGENPYQQLKEHDFLAMFSSRNSNIQIKALGITSKLAQSLSEDELKEVIQEISNCNSYVKGEARQALFDIALVAFDRCLSKQDIGILSKTEEQIYNESKALLLLGLVDSNIEVQKKCFAKWTQEERLPSYAPERLKTMFSLMYSPFTEEHFLSYCVPLMLHGTKVTPDFKSTVFPHGLDKCEYQKHDVNAHWTAKNVPMAPMFAQTMASLSSYSGSNSTSFSESTDRILATQESLMFEPTEDFVDGSYAASSQSKFDSSMVQSSFLFSPGDGTFSSHKGSFSKKMNYKQGLGFGTQRLRFLDESEHEPSSREMRPSRRFLGKNTASQVFGMVNVRKAKLREENWKNRARKRQSQVKLYRNYRKGDFPDIQIKFADFINPLMELAKRDTIIAKKVIVNLFTGVKTELQASGNLDPFEQQASSLLSNVLGTSTMYSSSTIGACLEIAYHCQFNIESQLVFEAAVGSDMRALGVLLLELNTSFSEEIWLQLAELYDGLGERDVAHAIMFNNVNLNPTAKLALEAHSEEQWLKAKTQYIQALTNTAYDNFYESCFECMAMMSEWGEIKRIIRKNVEDEERGLDTLWDDRWSMQNLLPRFLHCELLTLIHENTDRDQFLKVINSWLSDKVKGAALQGIFCETMSVLFLLKQQFVKSQFFGSKALSKFIDDWNDLNPLFRKRRETLLMSVQNIAEVMGFFSDGEGEELKSEVDCKAFLRKLEKISPVAEDSLMQWETRISFRIACMRCMPATGTMKAATLESSLKMQLSLVEVALLQGNQEFANKYLKITKKITSSAQNNALPDDCLINTRWELAFCKERHQFAEKEPDSAKRLHGFICAWDILDKIVAERVKDTELIISAHNTESNISFSIQQVISQNVKSLEVLKNRSKKRYDWLCSKLQLNLPSTSSEFVTSLENIGLNSLIYSKNETKHGKSQKMLGEVNLQMAQYCRKILESRKDGTSTDVTFTRPLVRAILTAMKCGSSRARQLFPLLLQLPNLSTDLAKDFLEKSTSVPVWMFLGWIPQILALLDTSAVDVIGPLLLKIAEKYPNAVTYPYKISRGNNLSCNASMLRLIKKLDSLLENNSLQTQLVRALSCLCHPSIILKDHYDKLVQSINSATVDWHVVHKNVAAVFEEVLDDCCGHRLSSRITGKFFSSLKNAKMDKLFEELRDAVKMKSKPSCDETLKKIAQALTLARESDMKNIKSHSKLKDFSPWLAEFSSSKMTVSIEIPGQYTGDQKPTPERHVMISRFEENVQIMPSLRRPVKLTFIGSDSSSNKFLVKYGEDLRQDERVQQLLRLMNGVFSHNQICRVRHLSVLTYKVVPLSSCLGIIEWVDNTSTLKELMLAPLSDEERKKVGRIGEAHRSWISGNSMEGINAKKLFGNAHKNLRREESVAQFSDLVSLTRPDVVRKGLALWSSSAEAFYWLRHSFIVSYSTLCVAHWLLGIGDRHLSNCLISESSGQCIGIDFGHSFGSATQFLPVPELVPFRLTPHIVNLAHPYGTTGLIEETMIRALRALQADPEVLLATMQVFIQEPSLDWLVMARKHFADSGDNPSWLPALKVEQAKRKLKGINPMAIVEEDLQSSHHNEFREAYLITLNGHARVNIRATLGKDGLTPRQQVQCLIDLATDENVLVKMWHGWEPWM